jgi:hypothetical protein
MDVRGIHQPVNWSGRARFRDSSVHAVDVVRAVRGMRNQGLGVQLACTGCDWVWGERCVEASDNVAQLYDQLHPVLANVR